MGVIYELLLGNNLWRFVTLAASAGVTLHASVSNPGVQKILSGREYNFVEITQLETWPVVWGYPLGSAITEEVMNR